MTNHLDPASPASPASAAVRAGNVTVVLGTLFLAATVVTYVLSLTDLINPPNWVRALALVWIPIGFLGTPVAFVLAWLGGERSRSLVGLLVMLVGLAAFVVLLFVAG